MDCEGDAGDGGGDGGDGDGDGDVDDVELLRDAESS